MPKDIEKVKEEFYNELAMYRDLTNHLLDPVKYVSHYLSSKGITVDSVGHLKDNGNTPKNLIEDRCYLEYLQDLAAYNRVKQQFQLEKVNKYAQGDIRVALESVVHNLEREAFETKVLETDFTGDDLSELIKWCKAINPAATDLDISKVAHFIWQVKRKMRKLPVKYHLFVLVYGPQEVGKSTAIEKLIQPFSPNSLCLKLEQLVDDKVTPALARSYAVFLDELDWKTREETSRLKNILTATHLSYRPMRSNSIIQLPNNSTVIAAANKRIDEIIHDPTGMRRYAEFLSANVIDHSAINSIDYLKLIKGIDENRELGYTQDFKVELKAEQAMLVTPEDIDMFLQDNNIDVGESDELISDVFEDYKFYCELSGFKPLDIKWFSKKLKHRGYNIRRTWQIDKNVTLIKTNRKKVSALKGII